MKTRLILAHAAATILAPALALLPGQVRAGEMPLTAEAIDRRLEKLFNDHEKITRVQAAITQRTQGPDYLFPKEESGMVRMRVPDKVRMDFRGEDGELILVDGIHVWEYYKAYEEVERYDLKSLDKAAGTWDVGALFLGESVAGAEEMRKVFVISGTREGNMTHLTLVPRDPGGENAPPFARIDMWLADEAAIPAKVITATKADTGKGFNTTTRALGQVATNLTGLPPFPPETFEFPIREDLPVFQKGGAAKENRLSWEQLVKDRQAWRGKQAQAAAREREGR